MKFAIFIEENYVKNFTRNISVEQGLRIRHT